MFFYTNTHTGIMTPIVHIELDVPGSIVQGYSTSICRQVLMRWLYVTVLVPLRPALMVLSLFSDISNKMYEGDFTSLLESESVDSALDQVYTKILQLFHQVSELRRIRNSFASITRLPNEIFLRIFHCCTIGVDRSKPGWFAFSQVHKLAPPRPGHSLPLDSFGLQAMRTREIDAITRTAHASHRYWLPLRVTTPVAGP